MPTIAARRLFFAMLLASASGAAQLPPLVIGDATPLRQVLFHAAGKHAKAGLLVTRANVAIMVIRFPTSLGIMASQLPRGILPWRPVWLYLEDVIESPKDREVIAKSLFALVDREEDGTTCMLNELTGKRILAQWPKEQDSTAVELPCKDVGAALTRYPLTTSDRAAIDERLFK